MLSYTVKQGLGYIFLECENRMWRIMNRSLPIGLQMDGGSDWFCLNYDFVHYLINSNDEYLDYLKFYFKYTLLPSESFFHSVILNSPFCDTIIDSNLRFTNWIRERGCQGCQYKHIVDWCSCSPNYFTSYDWFIFDVIYFHYFYVICSFKYLIIFCKF